LTIGAIALLNSWGKVDSQAFQSIKVNNSSTLNPITDAMAKEYQNTHPKKASITVEFSGPGGGFKKFCAGETDISNASRPMIILLS
jgi:phosphate transport system substrate-binding protein